MSYCEFRLGDSRELLKDFADDTFDSCVTDPPYALVSITKRFGKPGSAPAKDRDGLYKRASAGFMGRTWDTGETAFDAEFWRGVLRVMKPGAHLLAFGGRRSCHWLWVAIEQAGFEICDSVYWVYGSGFPKSHNQHDEWEGWGTALKPAVEPICLARKPLIGTVKKNLETYGTGCLNIDGCRVEADGGSPAAKRRATARITGNAPMQDRTLGVSTAHEAEDLGKIGRRGSAEVYMRERAGEALGRWPANLIHDGSDEVLEVFPNSDHPSRKSSRDGAARFFYCAKASKSERGEGNSHPTVKPIALMRYLCRLVTPPSGLILDPFMGSGSTGLAAIAEGFRFVGIEREEDYYQIAVKRLEAA